MGVKEIWTIRVKKKKERGRSRKDWDDIVKKALADKKETTVEAARILARDKSSGQSYARIE